MKINWGATLLVNFYRSFFAGVVYFIMYLLAGKEDAAFMLLFPLQYFLALLPVAWIFGKICDRAGGYFCFISVVLSIAFFVVFEA